MTSIGDSCTNIQFQAWADLLPSYQYAVVVVCLGDKQKTLTMSFAQTDTWESLFYMIFYSMEVFLLLCCRVTAVCHTWWQAGPCLCRATSLSLSKSISFEDMPATGRLASFMQ